MNEMENLNLDDLDVEELESRLELASGAGDPDKFCGIYWE